MAGRAARRGRGRLLAPISLLMVLSLGLSLIWVPAGSAQAPAPGIWQVRILESDETGILNPAGLAFSKQANAFQALEGGQASSAQVTGFGTLTGRGATRRIAAAIQNPINMAFDNKAGRLLMLPGAAGQVLEVRQSADGNPNPSLMSRRTVKGLSFRDPQGMTVDDSTGTLYILDASGPRLVRVSLDGNTATSIDLSKSGISSPRGIAFDPASGHLQVLSPSIGKLYELNGSGTVTATRDLAALDLQNPQGMTFAPSSDQTDDPAQMNLFVASASTAQSTGQIVELTLVAPATLPPGTTLLPTTLVRTFQTSNWTNPGPDIPAPDPSGIDYWPAAGKLVITDSEVEEDVNGNPPAYWHGFNVFFSTLSGSLTGNCTTFTFNPGVLWNDFTGEPAGFAINTDNGHFFFSSDGSNSKIYDLGFGPDGTYCTPDDTVTRILASQTWGTADSEDVAYGNNTLFISDGTNAEVYSIPLGANGVLGGGDDGPVTHWDTAALGFHDLEGIAFNPDAGTLFIVSTQGSENYLGETALNGTLLRAYDLSFMGTVGNIRSDVAWAPSSQTPGAKSIYIASRGIDNNSNRLENDGKVWEVSLGDNGPTATPTTPPTATLTPTPTSTNTPGPTPTNTSTSTPGPTPTSTSTPSGSDLIFADGFESGYLSAWTSSSTGGGDLSVSAAAALVGGLGMQAVINDNTSIFVTDDRPTAETRYRARFYLDPNSISMTSGDNFNMLIGYSGGGSYTGVVKIIFRFYKGSYQLRGGLLNNSSTWIQTGWLPISDASHAVEIDWQAATAPGANNGSLTMWIDGAQAASLTGVANDTRRVDRLRLGAVSGVDTGTRGTLLFDAFESRRQTYIGP